MSRSKGFVFHAATLVGLLAVAPAFAQTVGLGSSWPVDARDVSQAPGWHVYTWVKDGVKYIQVNDAAGKPRAAVAAANGHVLTLPVGQPADRVVTGSADAGAVSVSPAPTIYNDGNVKISTDTTSSNATTFQVQTAAGCDWRCGGHQQQ